MPSRLLIAHRLIAGDHVVVEPLQADFVFGFVPVAFLAGALFGLAFLVVVLVVAIVLLLSQEQNSGSSPNLKKRRRPSMSSAASARVR